MSIANKIRLGLLVSIIFLVMCLKINCDNNKIAELKSEIESNQQTIESYNQDVDNLKNQIDNWEDKYYELKDMAADGTLSTDIDSWELTSKILGFNIREIETTDKSEWYYYNTLGDYQKEDYLKILYCLAYMNSIADLRETDANKIEYLYKCVTMDHETLFWVNGYIFGYNEESENYSFTGKYEEELFGNPVNLYNAWCKIQEYKEAVLSQMNNFMTEQEKEVVIFNYIAMHTEYEKQSYQNQSLYSVVREKSVCAGMSKMFKYLCDEAGIKCICCLGNSKETGVGHMWNIVKVNGANKMVDCTNALRRYSNGTVYIDYNYFNTAHETMEERYIINTDYKIPIVLEG